MKKYKIFSIALLLFLLVGCQNKKLYKYAVYNRDPGYSFVTPGVNIEMRPEFTSEFALPLTEEQLTVIKKQSEKIVPFFMFSTFTSELPSNQVVVTFDGEIDPQYNMGNAAGRIIPYFDESDIIGSVQKKYIGEIDENKEYVYISQFFANTLISNLYSYDLNALLAPTTLSNLLNDEFTEEICIKATFYVPVSSYSSEKMEGINDGEFGPFDTYEYEYQTVEKEYYVKGLISSFPIYYDEAGAVIFVNEESYNNLASTSVDNVESATKIVFSKTKDITKTFDELGLEYQILNQ